MPQRPVASVSMLQETPLPVGRTSLRLTPVAVPLPLLFTEMVNPMLLPALTEGASDVFTTPSVGQSTVVESLAFTEGWFVAVIVATLGYAPHEPPVVGLVTCTNSEPPG